MSDEIYLTITGEQQGCISSRCGTSASIGNRWQIGHEDEIFAFSLSNSITNTGKGSQLHGLSFCKLIDKSSPLLINAINNNEQLFMEFDFYRINRFGRWEKYYNIQLRGALLSAINHLFTENNLDTETITVSYEYILSVHLIANTEFSHLAFPDNYNRLFIPRQKLKIIMASKHSIVKRLADCLLLAAYTMGISKDSGKQQTSWEEMHLLVTIKLWITKGYSSLVLQ